MQLERLSRVIKRGMSDYESESYSAARQRTRTRVQAARQELVCPICIETFNEPRTLACQHTFCTVCLLQLAATATRRTARVPPPLKPSTAAACGVAVSSDVTVACPECRANIVLPEDGVVGLPKNFKLERIIEILSPIEREELNRGSVHKMRTFRCLTHTKKSADYFCTTCNRLACGDCLLEMHLNHEGVKRATEVLAEHVQALRGLIPGAREVLETGEASLSSIQSLSNSITEEGVEAIQGVKNYFAKIHSLLKKRESEIERDILGKMESRREKIEQDSLALQQSVGEFRDCTRELEGVTQRESFEILVKEEEIRARLNSGRAALEASISQISKLKNLAVKPPPLEDTKLEVLCRTLGNAPPKPLPRRRQDKPTPPPRSSSPNDAFPGLNSTEADYALTPDIDRVKETEREDLTESIESDTTPMTTDDFPMPKPPMRNESHRCTPTVIKPELIWGPQNMSSSFFQSATGSVYPRGVCCGVSGTVLVTDIQNHCVRILASTGKCLDVVGREGKSDGQFGEPTSVTTDRDGNMLVCDLCPARLQKFSSQGVFISKMNTRFLRGNPLGEPWGVAVGYDGTIYVSDWDKSCIHTYSDGGRYLNNFGSSGSDTPLKYPAGIAIDKRGRIVVADRGNHVVCIYTPEGNLLNRFGKMGRAPGDLYFPFGVAISRDGANIFISESGNHRISVFDSQGKFIRCFGKKGSDPGMFHLPRHLFIDKSDRLFVSDEQNQRIQIFTSY